MQFDFPMLSECGITSFWAALSSPSTHEKHATELFPEDPSTHTSELQWLAQLVPCFLTETKKNFSVITYNLFFFFKKKKINFASGHLHVS